jgi:peptidylprolyl isomerase
MKLMLPALLLVAAVAATAQTPTRKAPVTHHRATAPAKTAAPAAAPIPNIPAVPGVPKTLYTLKYIDTVIGTGPLAEPQKWYTVRYTGWTAGGTKFDSTNDHPGGEPITFPYGARRVIIGWDTGFEGMHVGGKRRLFIPYQLAYGETGRPPVIPAKADLIFDIELVSMSDTPPEPPAPAPAAQPDTEAAPSGAPTAAPAEEAKPADAPSTPTETPAHPEGI